MDFDQVLIFDLGWAFFAGWLIVLATLSAITFGRDLFPFIPRLTRGSDRH